MTASGSPSTGRGRCSASVRIWKAAERTSTLVAVTAVSCRLCRGRSSSNAQLCASSPRIIVERAAAANGQRGAELHAGALLRRAGLDACAWSRVSALWRTHIVRRPSGPDGDPAPTLILDAGTGLRTVTPLIGRSPRSTGTILLSHLHWDHVQGLPFFAAGDRRRRAPDGAAARSTGRPATRPPCWPVRCRRRISRWWPGGLRGSWAFATHPRPASLHVEGSRCSSGRYLTRGGATFGYRVSDGHSTFAYMPDHCPTALGLGPDGQGEYHEAALELAKQRRRPRTRLPAADTSRSLPLKGALVTPSPTTPLELGQRAGARSVVLFHHWPDRTDDALDRLARRLRAHPGCDAPLAVQGSVWCRS